MVFAVVLDSFVFLWGAECLFVVGGNVWWFFLIALVLLYFIIICLLWGYYFACLLVCLTCLLCGCLLFGVLILVYFDLWCFICLGLGYWFGFGVTVCLGCCCAYCFDFCMVFILYCCFVVLDCLLIDLSGFSCLLLIFGLLLTLLLFDFWFD